MAASLSAYALDSPSIRALVVLEMWMPAPLRSSI